MASASQRAAWLQAAAAGISNANRRLEFIAGVQAMERGEDDTYFDGLIRWRWRPVGIDVFIEHPDLLNLKGEVWPRVMDELVEITTGSYTEVIFTGAIGAAKTYKADLLFAYQLYLMTCLADPHREFGLSAHTNIAFVLQSVTEKAAQKVLFSFLSRILRRSRYFNRLVPYEKGIKSELRFPNNFVVEPVASGETAAIGENVCGAILDEANFRQVVVGSARAPWLDTYDAAVQAWNAMASRMRSRFLKRGKLPGLLIGVSSSRYPEDFTERKMAEAEREQRDTGKSLIYVSSHAVWEVAPPGKYNPGTFRLLVAKGLEKSRILAEDEAAPLEGELLDVPTDLRKDFEADLERAIREVAGRPTRAIHPFIARREKILKATTRSDRPHAFTKLVTSLRDGVGFVLEAFDDVDIPRAAHLDLAVNRDAAGIAIGYTLRTVSVDRTVLEAERALAEGRGDLIETIRTAQGVQRIERAPFIVIEAVLPIVAPAGDEIMLEDVVSILLTLREVGVPITWCTADTYQSVAPLQMLRDRGILTGIQSVDREPEPYENLKSALYDERLEVFGHPTLVREWASLEKNEKTSKIDHPAWTVDLEGNKVKGSKDVSDAVAGVVHFLSRRRESWRVDEEGQTRRRNVNRGGRTVRR